jgi:hypothetical protein
MSIGAPHIPISQIRIKATATPISLILEIDFETKMELQNLRAELNFDGSDAFSSEDNLHEIFEWLTCNSEYEFVQPEETGDLTSAPLLGIRDERGNIVQRWGFMDYQLRAPQDDLADAGRCRFVGFGASSEMTLKELYETPWNCMSDYPKVGYPWRAPVLAKIDFKNENGVLLEARVVTNRTRNRFWIEIKYSDNNGFGSLHLYQTTTSKKKADLWIAAIRCGVIGRSDEENSNA